MSVFVNIDNLKHDKMLDPLAHAWQSGSVLPAQTPCRIPCIGKQITSLRFPITETGLDCKFSTVNDRVNRQICHFATVSIGHANIGFPEYGEPEK